MDLNDLIDRRPIIPWSGLSKIPWSEPQFSARMLREHLDQQQTAASRTFPVVDEQVAWIHALLGKTSQRVLDLGCGPGFYTERLARLGHVCVGIDFSPASIDYARSVDETSEYRLADLRDGEYGRDFDAALLIYGEFNAFPPETAGRVLECVSDALNEGGRLILEPHEKVFLRAQGQRPPHWFTSNASVFSDQPHVCLRESQWFEAEQATTDRYFVIETEVIETEVIETEVIEKEVIEKEVIEKEVIETGTRAVTEYINTLQAYSDAEYEQLLESAGFVDVQRFPSLCGRETPDTEGLTVITALKRS